jgi:exosome complex component MTR3
MSTSVTIIEDLQDAEDRSIAVAIYQALVPSVRLELLPKSTVDVFITIIETDGMEGCISSGVVAASTALADAGIEMLGLVMSCSAVCVLFHHYNRSHLPQALVGTETWLDPTAEEARLSQGTLVLSCMPALGIITSLWESGQMKTEEVLAVGSFFHLKECKYTDLFFESMNLCHERCIDIHSVVAQALLETA